MYTASICRSISPVRAEWDALADRVGSPPFLRPGWIEAWEAAFSPKRPVRVICARRGERLVGVLPMVLGRMADTAPVDWHTPVFGAVAESDAAHAALADALIARRVARVDLGFVDSSDPGLAALRRAAADSGYRVAMRSAMRSPYVRLDRDFEAYEASLGRKHRKEIGRLGRRVAAEGSVEYAFETGSERLEERLDEGFAIEGSGWKSEAGSAIISRPETHRFYRDVARWAAGRGTLVLAFMRLDGRAIAFDMCIEEGGAIHVLKGGFDPEYRRFGPGTLLTAASIERAYERGLDTYELLGSEQEYKLAWTGTVRERVRFQAFSPSVAGRVNHFGWTHGRALAKRAIAEARRRRR